MVERGERLERRGWREGSQCSGHTVGMIHSTVSSDSEGGRRVVSGSTGVSPIHPRYTIAGTCSILSSACLRLLWWLGASTAWTYHAFLLLLYILAMLPGLLPAFVRYLCSPAIVKNVPYGDRFRQQLDIYLPTVEHQRGRVWEQARNEATSKEPVPVVFFVTGGAWIIGYKCWAFIMGMCLQRQGVLCVVPDYRNFPQATVEDMVADLRKALEWAASNVGEFGGDPLNISLVGQSAGAHLSLLLACEGLDPDAPPLPVLRRWVGVSGPYHIPNLAPHLVRRGLDEGILRAVMGQDLERWSPAIRLAAHTLQGPSATTGSPNGSVPPMTSPLESLRAGLIPSICLFHGEADRTVPVEQTRDLAKVLNILGVQIEMEVYYKGKTHTDLILEDPLSGNDQLTSDLLEVILGKNMQGEKASPPCSPHGRSICLPESPSPPSRTIQAGELYHEALHPQLVRLARAVCPF